MILGITDYYHRKRKNARIPKAYSGTDTRTYTLPHIHLKPSESDEAKIKYPFNKSSDDVTLASKLTAWKTQTESASIHIIYIQDKYSFSRILTSDTLVFDFHFESGNLHSAFRVISANTASTKHIYELYLNCDINSPGNNIQWYQTFGKEWRSRSLFGTIRSQTHCIAKGCSH